MLLYSTTSWHLSPRQAFLTQAAVNSLLGVAPSSSGESDIGEAVVDCTEMSAGWRHGALARRRVSLAKREMLGPVAEVWGDKPPSPGFFCLAASMSPVVGNFDLRAGDAIIGENAWQRAVANGLLKVIRRLDHPRKSRNNLENWRGR